MRPLWRPAGTGLPIPASSPALAAGEGVEEGLGVARVRFRALDGVEGADGGRRTGDPRWRPARLLLAGEGGSGKRTGEARSTHACQRGCWRVQLGKNAGGAGYSPWRPLLAPAAMRLAAGERWPSP
jgi:hypothetical protein